MPASAADTSLASNSRPNGSASGGVNIGHDASATIDESPSCVTATARIELVPASMTRTGSDGTSAHRLRVYSVFQRFACDKARDLASHHAGLAFNRFRGRASNVRGEHDVPRGQQRTAQWQGLALKYVERGARYFPGVERVHKSISINDGSSAGVDEKRICSHRGEKLFADQSLRAFVVRDM